VATADSKSNSYLLVSTDLATRLALDILSKLIER